MTTIRGEDLEVDGKVSKAKVDWRVREDGALAHQLQEEEFSGHYSGNITRNRTVRQDVRTAKDVAEEEALLAFKEEHDQVERNREIEEKDRQAAEQLYKQMLEEERTKIRNQHSFEEDDEDIARRLQENEKKKAAMMRAQEQATIEEKDEDIAKRLQAHEERKAAILRQRQQEKDAMLARRISQSERPGLPETPRSPSGDINGIAQGTATMSILSDDSLPEYPAPLPPKHSKRNSAPASPPKYDPNYERPMDARAGPNRHERDTATYDDDDRTNVEAEELADDAEIARRLQREEIKKSRRSRQKPENDEDEQKRLQHDERIARKMQHEEVMIAKNKYHKYKERVDDEIASPEPMTHVSRTNKTAVSKDAKYDHGITLTDYKPNVEGSQLRGHSETQQSSAQRHSYETIPNVAAAIDPTYTKSDSGNVLLTQHRRSLNQGPPSGSTPGEVNRIEAEVDDNIQPVQGSRRKNEKMTKKKSIFSKLKKK